MEIFAKSFGRLLVFVYHCFDRIVINGYLSGLSRPEQVVYFFRQVIGVSAVTKEGFSQRTGDYHGWVESFARNYKLPIEWAEKGVRKEGMFGTDEIERLLCSHLQDSIEHREMRHKLRGMSLGVCRGSNI